MKNKTKKLVLIMGILVTVCGCNSSDSSLQNASEGSSAADSILNSVEAINRDELNDILESIPSPLEFSSLMQNSGAQYTELYLNKTNNSNRYTSEHTKAINLGIYGADLGYINLYEKTYSAIEYLNVVHSLATDLNIGGYFDFETLKRLVSNNRNLDSVVNITTKSFEKMHRQLKKSNSSHISVLMITGGWIEGVYLTTEAIRSTDSPQAKDLMSTIFDERIVLEDILILLNAYKENPNFGSLIKDLEDLKKIFSSIASANANNDGSISEIQFNDIANEVKLIRNKLIG